MKSIILCADDYGQNSTISQAIIELIQRKRLSATSCLTTSSHWPEHAKWLKDYQNQVDIGLHFNLTESVAGGYPLSTLILRSALRLLDKTHIQAELNAQIDSFVNEMGCLPDYIDGHQHVHQLPVVREALFAVYEERLRHAGCYIRCVYTPDVYWRVTERGYIKQLVIHLLGATSFKMQLLQRKIPHNASFSGIYAFSKSSDYRDHFVKFLSKVSDNGLIMCHPGLVSTTTDDVIRGSRSIENAYFLSEQFLLDCQTDGVRITRFRK